MRLIVPSEIRSLTDIFSPYMIKNSDETALILRSDAPDAAKTAHKKYIDWWETHYRQP